MEKVSSKSSWKIISILGGKTTEEWLKSNGYVKHKNLGWIKQSRLDHCLQKGYIRHDYKEGLTYTKTGLQTDFLKYLWGDSDTVSEKKKAVNETKREARPKKEKVDVESIFGDMVE